MGFGYCGQYICQSYEPLLCGVICSENYGLEEKTQDNIFALAEVCYECGKCVEPWNEPYGEPSPVLSSVPSGEASVVPNTSPIHDPSKELAGVSPVPSSAPSGEARAVQTLYYPNKELTCFPSPLCIGDLIIMGYGYGRHYSCQGCEPLSCGFICSEKYCLVEKHRMISL